jgi:hypothetical protein
MIRNLENTVYQKNKVYWHSKHTGELHHAIRRSGWRLCCLHTFICGTSFHENDYEWVNAVRKTYHYFEQCMAKQYVRGEGCVCPMFTIECKDCAMKKLGREYAR